MNPSRSSILLLLALSFGACASNPLPRQPLAPAPSPDVRPVVEEVRVRTDAVERGAAQPTTPEQAPQPEPQPNPARPSGTAYQESRYEGPRYRTVVETVEVPVERYVPVAAQPGYDRYDAYVDGYRSGRRQPNPFPINTAIGAGVGAIIGHQSGHRGRGAWIGSGVGLLFDIGRWTNW